MFACAGSGTDSCSVFCVREGMSLQCCRRGKRGSRLGCKGESLRLKKKTREAVGRTTCLVSWRCLLRSHQCVLHQPRTLGHITWFTACGRGETSFRLNDARDVMTLSLCRSSGMWEPCHGQTLQCGLSELQEGPQSLQDASLVGWILTRKHPSTLEKQQQLGLPASYCQVPL